MRKNKSNSNCATKIREIIVAFCIFVLLKLFSFSKFRTQKFAKSLLRRQTKITMDEDIFKTEFDMFRKELEVPRFSKLFRPTFNDTHEYYFIHAGTSYYLRTDFHILPQGIQMIYGVSHSNLHFQPFLFHPISHALYPLKVRYRLQPPTTMRCGSREDPAGAFASVEFSSRIARPCRAPCPGTSNLARGIETRRTLVREPECHYAARFPALIK